MIPAEKLRAWLDRRAEAGRERDRVREEHDRAYIDAFIRDRHAANTPAWAVKLGERLDRIEARLAAGVPRPGRCGVHPKNLPSFVDCSRLAYACELDAGHAGMHRDGTMEWGPRSASLWTDVEHAVGWRRAGYSREEC